MIFPKICPAVIVAVTDNDRILLTKYAGRMYRNYALIAGFNEAGETLEQTVVRETVLKRIDNVMESVSRKNNRRRKNDIADKLSELFG